MEPTVSPRRAELVADTLRRFVRRGARSKISNLLGKTRPEDAAILLQNLTPAQQLSVFDVLVADYPETVGDVLTEVEPALRHSLLDHQSPQQIARFLERMPVDDAVFIVESLPSEQQDSVLELVDLRDLDEVQAQLTYEDDSAGRIMDPEYFVLQENRTVEEAIRSIRESKDLENIFYVYVIDKVGHLVGVASLRQLLLTEPGREMGEIMTRSLIKVQTNTDQEEVAQLAARYDLLAIPVTDDSNRLVGIVTVDDIIDVVKEEATEDFYKMVGTSDDEIQYQEHSLRVAGIRLPWLLANYVGLLATGVLLRNFEAGINALEYFKNNTRDALFMLLFVPAIMGMGGNIGSQTSTITVRGLATGRVVAESGRVRRFLWQQFKVGFVIAFVCAILVGLSAVLLKANTAFALVVGTAMFLSLLVAAFNGSLIPVMFQRLGIDPAVAAGPLVTTSNDVSGILIYYGLAYYLFGLVRG